MTTLAKIVLAGAVILSAASLVISLNKSDAIGGSLGAVGVKLIENYSPYVRYNGGINTALPMSISALLKATGTFQLGASGTAQANQVTANCSPKADVSIAATSSGYAYCTGVTGVTSADNVVAQISTSTAAFTLTKDNFWIISAKASTTAGAIDFLVYNGTGAAAVPSAVGQAASTTNILASH